MPSPAYHSMNIVPGCFVDTEFGCGFIRFMGSTSFAKGEWFGIELLQPNGKNNGSVDGVLYFKCGTNYGVFMKRDQFKLLELSNQMPCNNCIRLHEQQLETSELLEAISLDKEMAEEKLEQCQELIEEYKKKNFQLEQSFYRLQKEQGNPESVVKLKTALVKLNDQFLKTSKEKDEFELLYKELQQLFQSLKEDLDALKYTHERTFEENVQLKEYLDGLSEPNRLIEELSEKNLKLEEKIASLENIIEKFENLSDINAEIEEDHRNKEKVLNETIWDLQDEIQKQQEQLLRSANQILSLKQLISSLNDVNDLRKGKESDFFSNFSLKISAIVKSNKCDLFETIATKQIISDISKVFYNLNFSMKTCDDLIQLFLNSKEIPSESLFTTSVHFIKLNIIKVLSFALIQIRSLFTDENCNKLHQLNQQLLFLFESYSLIKFDLDLEESTIADQTISGFLSILNFTDKETVIFDRGDFKSMLSLFQRILPKKIDCDGIQVGCNFFVLSNSNPPKINEFLVKIVDFSKGFIISYRKKNGDAEKDIFDFVSFINQQRYAEASPAKLSFCEEEDKIEFKTTEGLELGKTPAPEQTHSNSLKEKELVIMELESKLDLSQAKYHSCLKEAENLKKALAELERNYQSAEKNQFNSSDELIKNLRKNTNFSVSQKYIAFLKKENLILRQKNLSKLLEMNQLPGTLNWEKSSSYELFPCMTSEFERKHVHQVYQAIAPHFSETRYKPWPIVDKFINDQPIYSTGADVGCGNGKYMNLRKNQIVMLGCDYCEALVTICKEKNLEVMVSDNLSLPFLSESLDFAISIAVIHHFSSKERRMLAIKELCRIVKSKGRILIFVWAFEQEGKRKYADQDAMVSWKFTEKYNQQNDRPVYERYYHLFKEKELDGIIAEIQELQLIESGYDRDNWYVIVEKTNV